MRKELNVGEWYYRMMGYGGGDSQYCCIRRKTGEKTASGMMSLFNGTGKIQTLPVVDIYEAVDECGRTFKVSANNLAANGHIGIGTLEEPKSNGHVAWLYREDARLLVETGKYTADEITAVFTMALTDYGDAAYEKYIEEHSHEFTPMTDKQEEILKAAYAANCEKQKREVEEANKKYAAEVAALRQKYHYIPCPKTDGKWLTVGEKRRNILAVLKHEFPGVKFKAHTRNGSTSDSIRVEYEDGPSYDKVMKVLNAFETTTYNAYEDIHEDSTQPAACVCGGFDYVFLNRTTSQDVYQFVYEYIKGNVGGASEEYARTTASRVVKRTDFPAGSCAYEIDGLELVDSEWVLRFKTKTPPQSPTPPDAPKGKGIEVRHNEKKNGIEISFSDMPSENIRNLMKGAGWRWSRFNKVWYNTMCDRSVASAEQIVAEWEKENGTAAA